MLAPINSIALPSLVSMPSAGTGTAGGAGQNTFQDLFKSAVQHVENSAAQADSAVSGYLAGNNQELHSTILATQNADLDFNMFLQVRNKVVSAYEEIMKMQV